MAALADESDEELKLAIALSLQDAEAISSTTPKAMIVDLISDHEEPRLATTSVRSVGVPPPNTVEAHHSTLLGMDRRAMEQERLARKRKASEISSDARPTRTAESVRLSSKPAQVGMIQEAQTPSPLSSNHPVGVVAQPRLPYAEGVIKKTWCFGFPRRDDVKIEEILDAASLDLAVLSAFQWDVSWLLQKINNPSTKLIFAMQAKDESTKRMYERDTADMPNLRLCFPPMPGQTNCMHSKLMLLSFSTHLRIAVPSANLVPYDWGETGVMENMVFLIDLPRLPNGTILGDDEMTFFGNELAYFCKAMNLSPEIVASLYKFDFSATKGIAFVHSIGGEHSGENEPWRRTGYCGLGRAVTQLGLNDSEEVLVDYVASSIGAVKQDLLTMMYLACQGDDGITEYTWRTEKASSRTKNSPGMSARQQLTVERSRRSLHVYYPSKSSVLASIGGPDNAGTICFQSKWYDMESFPKDLLRDYRSTRTGLLMHTKVMFVQPLRSAKHNPETRAWVYVGSANFSESAWGRLVLDRATKLPKLNCRNWECGVILPITASTKQRSQTDSIPNSLDIFKERLPVPFTYPGESMLDRRPWFSSGE